VYEPEEQRGILGIQSAAPFVPLLIVLGFIVAVGIAQMSIEMEQGVAIDYYQFWAIGSAAEVLPGESIYTLANGERLARILFERAAQIESPALRAAARFRAQRIDAASTPFFYACFRAVRTGDYDTDLRRFRLGSLVAFVLATLLIGPLVGCTPTTTLAALAFFLWAFPPLRFNLSEGNVNAVQLVMMALLLWMRRDPDSTWRTVAAGCLLSLAVLFKPNLAMVAVLLVLGWGFLKRKRNLVQAALGIALGIAIALAASALLFGTTASWGNWFEAVRHLDRDFAVGVDLGNLGGARLVGDALGWDPTVLLLIILVGIVAGQLLLGRRALANARASVPFVRKVDSLLIALGPAVAILGTAIAWPHYAILCVPLCLVCLQQIEDEKHLVRTSVLLVMAAFAGLSSTGWLDAIGVQAPLAQALALALGILALYTAGVRALARLVRNS
jgi:hypothetical protein